MKKLIFTYLNETYPETYRYMTKFGYDIRGYNETNTNWSYVRSNMVETIMNLFSCNWITADDTVNEWIDTLRVVKSVHLNESDRKVLFTYYKITLSPE